MILWRLERTYIGKKEESRGFWIDQSGLGMSYVPPCSCEFPLNPVSLTAVHQFLLNPGTANAPAGLTHTTCFIRPTSPGPNRMFCLEQLWDEGKVVKWGKKSFLRILFWLRSIANITVVYCAVRIVTFKNGCFCIICRALQRVSRKFGLNTIT